MAKKLYKYLVGQEEFISLKEIIIATQQKLKSNQRALKLLHENPELTDGNLIYVQQKRFNKESQEQEVRKKLYHFLKNKYSESLLIPEEIIISFIQKLYKTNKNPDFLRSAFKITKLEIFKYIISQTEIIDNFAEILDVSLYKECVKDNNLYTILFSLIVKEPTPEGVKNLPKIMLENKNVVDDFKKFEQISSNIESTISFLKLRIDSESLDQILLTVRACKVYTDDFFSPHVPDFWNFNFNLAKNLLLRKEFDLYHKLHDRIVMSPKKTRLFDEFEQELFASENKQVNNLLVSYKLLTSVLETRDEQIIAKFLELRDTKFPDLDCSMYEQLNFYFSIAEEVFKNNKKLYILLYPRTINDAEKLSGYHDFLSPPPLSMEEEKDDGPVLFGESTELDFMQ